MSLSKKYLWLLFLATALAAFGLSMLANSIMNRKAESKFAYAPQVVIGENEPRNQVWGENFPRQYQSFLRTADTSFLSYQNGNKLRDVLDKNPNLVVLWAGYGFSKDYNSPRGHFYAINDLQNSLRTGGPTKPGQGPMPATCWTCKSPDIPRLMNEIGIDEFYRANGLTRGQK